MLDIKLAFLCVSKIVQECELREANQCSPEQKFFYLRYWPQFMTEGKGHRKMYSAKFYPHKYKENATKRSSAFCNGTDVSKN